MTSQPPSPFSEILTKALDLHGDRTESDARCVWTGLAWIDSTRFLLAAATETTERSASPPALRQVARPAPHAPQLRRPLLLAHFGHLNAPNNVPLLLLNEYQRLMTQLVRLSLPVVLVGAIDETFAQDFVTLELPSGGTEAVRLLRHALDSAAQNALDKDPGL